MSRCYNGTQRVHGSFSRWIQTRFYILVHTYWYFRWIKTAATLKRSSKVIPNNNRTFDCATVDIANIVIHSQEKFTAECFRILWGSQNSHIENDYWSIVFSSALFLFMRDDGRKWDASLSSICSHPPKCCCPLSKGTTLIISLYTFF